MQGDGNLVLYTVIPSYVWASWTHTFVGATLKVRNDGAAIIEHNNVIVWSTNTGGRTPNLSKCSTETCYGDWSAWEICDPSCRPEKVSRTRSCALTTDQENEFQLCNCSVNDLPVAADDFITTPEDTAVVIYPLTNDSDPENGTLTIASIAVSPTSGTVVNNNDGTITYTPNIGYVGSDSFMYSLSDGNGGTSTGTVTVTVAAGFGMACTKAVDLGEAGM